MDSKIVTYQELIKQIFNKYIELFNRRPEPDAETLVIMDDTEGHYIIHTIGWQETKRVWNTTLYVRVRNEKFWIEIDWTSPGIATDLLEAGIPKGDIVLAFHHPQMRPLTEFAVA